MLRRQRTNRTTRTYSPYFKNKNASSPDIKQEVKSEILETELAKTEEIKPDMPPSEGCVPDNLDYDLRVVFVGINPGLTSAAQRHHFAGPTNHFWPCLTGSGLVNRKVTFLDDVHLPEEFRLGMTNLTNRASRRANDLTMEEQRKGIPTLTAKFRHYRPRVACFVGKGMYEIYNGGKCMLGLQEKTVPWDNGQGVTRLFVMPSTSGIVSAYQKPDKLKFFQELCAIATEEDAKYPPVEIKCKKEEESSNTL